MVDRYAIAQEAREWVGTRWHHGASLKGVGTDCVGLLAGVGRAVGVANIPAFDRARDYKGYGRDPDPRLLLRGCAEYLTPIPVKEAGLGDILLFRFTEHPQHFAIISRLDPVYIVHAYAQARRTVENRLDHLWAQRVVYAFRFVGVG